MPSGIRLHPIWQKFSSVSKRFAASIFRVDLAVVISTVIEQTTELTCIQVILPNK